LSLRALIPLALLAAAIAAILFAPAGQPIFGLDRSTLARMAGGAALLVWLLFAGVRRARPGDLTRVVSAAIVWAALLIGLIGIYAYRYEVSDFATRVVAELIPSEPQVGQGGEVIVNRRLSGEFVVAAKVDGTPVSFLFDTGASTVVLTAADARRIGVVTANLDFDISVTTANGSAMAAETRLDELAVGPIAARNVRALVAKPGALTESLLGMSFLERLQSYTVERGRLVLRAK
jgi:aspartyl protease family protein